MIDTCVNSDWAKTIIVTFVLKIINSKSVSRATFTRGGFIQVNVETDKDVIRKSSNKKEKIWIKTNMEKKVDKVLPSKIFILISFKEKVFIHINSQQMWMNTFSSSSRVDCVIQINFDLDAVDKGWKLLYCKRYQSE